MEHKTVSNIDNPRCKAGVYGNTFYTRVRVPRKATALVLIGDVNHVP